MNRAMGAESPVLASVPSTDRADKISESLSDYTKLSNNTQSQSPGDLRPLSTLFAPHPNRPQRYLLQIRQGNRRWSYPLAWSRAEVMALKMMARQQLQALDLSLTPKGPPVDVGRLHQLIEKLYPSVVRVAAMAQEVAANA